jgi:hypothetical protein
MHSPALPNPVPTEGSQGTRRSRGIATSKHLARLKPLTWAFAPLAGLEPATYGLEVDPRPSVPSHTVPSWLVR